MNTSGYNSTAACVKRSNPNIRSQTRLYSAKNKTMQQGNMLGVEPVAAARGLIASMHGLLALTSAPPSGPTGTFTVQPNKVFSNNLLDADGQKTEFPIKLLLFS